MPKNIIEMLKKFDEVKKLVKNMQNQFKDKRIEVNTGAGLVRVVANGNQEIIEIHIDPELIKLKDKKLLEDLVKSAVNQAKEEAMKLSQELIKESMGTGFDAKNLGNLFSD